MSKGLSGGNKVITSIIREQIGIKNSLGTLTLKKEETWYTIIRKGFSFIQRNIAKREGGASEEEIKTAIRFLFFAEDKDITVLTEEPDYEEYREYRERYNRVNRMVHPDFKGRKASLAEIERMEKLKLESENLRVGEYLSLAKTNMESGMEEPVVHGSVEANIQGKKERINFVIGQPKGVLNNKNGAIYNYQRMDEKLFVISLDRLVAISIYANIIKEYEDLDSLDQLVYDMIIYYFHRAMPQHKSNMRKSWGYNMYDHQDISREERSEAGKRAEDIVKRTFMRAYRAEINIKSMEEYERNLGRTVATSFDTKKNIPPSIIEEMKNTKFRDERFSFVELDEDIDIEKFKVLEQYYLDVKKVLKPVKLTALRFRKLGKHSVAGSPAAGLYSPFHQAMAVDIRHSYSFIHEYGHAIDYLTDKDTIQSLNKEFLDILDAYSKYLPNSVKGTARSYFNTPTEVFARAYEVAFRDKFPNLATGLIRPVEVMQKNPAYAPFYKDEDFYKEVVNYMEQYF